MTTLLSLLGRLGILKLHRAIKLDESKLIGALAAPGPECAAFDPSLLNDFDHTDATSAYIVHRSADVYDTYGIINGHLRHILYPDAPPIHKLPLEFEPHSVAMTNPYAARRTFYLLAPSGILHVIRQEGPDALIEPLYTPSLVWRLGAKHATCLDGTVIDLP